MVSVEHLEKEPWIMSIDSSPGPTEPLNSSAPMPSLPQEDKATVRSRTAWTARRRLHTPYPAESPKRGVSAPQKRMAAADPNVMDAAKSARLVSPSDEVHGQKDEKNSIGRSH